MSKTKIAYIKNIIIVSLLITIAVGWRIVNHSMQLAPNLELVTVASVIACLIVGARAGIIVPVASMVISDCILGNSDIFIFTWGSFAIIGLGTTIFKKLNNKPANQILSSIGFAAGSSFLFFAVTNFGVWLQGWYPATLNGLMTSYAQAIPFYRTMLIGNLILVPAAVAVYQYIKAKQTAKNLVVDTFIGN